MWKQLILNSQQFLPQGLSLCSREEDLCIIQTQNSWAFSDTSKETWYLILEWTKHIFWLWILGKAEERKDKHFGNTCFQVVSTGQNLPRKTLLIRCQLCQQLNKHSFNIVNMQIMSKYFYDSYKAAWQTQIKLKQNWTCAQRGVKAHRKSTLFLPPRVSGKRIPHDISNYFS